MDHPFPSVLIVSSDPLARAGLRALLEPEIEVVAELDPDDDLTGWQWTEVDVVLWDVKQATPETLSFDAPVLALVAEAKQIASIRGVQGVLRRATSAGQLVQAVTALTLGLAVLEPDLLADLLASRTQPEADSEIEPTPREREVLELLALGLPNKAIARRLDISENTVKFHVNALLTKFGASTRTEVATRAVQLGFVTF